MALGPLIRLVRPDLGRHIADRRGALGSIERWAETRPAGRRVWLHGASAGELLGAAPAIAALRARADARLFVSHFSPSGRDALDRLAPFQQQVNNALFDGLSREEFAVFAGLIERFVNNSQDALAKVAELEDARQAAE